MFHYSRSAVSVCTHGDKGASFATGVISLAHASKCGRKCPNHMHTHPQVQTYTCMHTWHFQGELLVEAQGCPARGVKRSSYILHSESAEVAAGLGIGAAQIGGLRQEVERERERVGGRGGGLQGVRAHLCLCVQVCHRSIMDKRPFVLVYSAADDKHQKRCVHQRCSQSYRGECAPLLVWYAGF